MLQLGLLRVVTSPGSQFLQKIFLGAKLFGAHPFSMMFFSPKFNYLDTSTHLSKSIIMVSWTRQSLTFLLFVFNHVTCSLHFLNFPDFCLTDLSISFDLAGFLSFFYSF